MVGLADGAKGTPARVKGRLVALVRVGGLVKRDEVGGVTHPELSSLAPSTGESLTDELQGSSTCT